MVVYIAFHVVRSQMNKQHETFDINTRSVIISESLIRPQVSDVLKLIFDGSTFHVHI